MGICSAYMNFYLPASVMNDCLSIRDLWFPRWFRFGAKCWENEGLMLASLDTGHQCIWNSFLPVRVKGSVTNALASALLVRWVVVNPLRITLSSIMRCSYGAQAVIMEATERGRWKKTLPRFPMKSISSLDWWNKEGLLDPPSTISIDIPRFWNHWLLIFWHSLTSFLFRDGERPILRKAIRAVTNSEVREVDESDWGITGWEIRH